MNSGKVLSPVWIKDFKLLRLLNLSDPFEQIVSDVFENVSLLGSVHLLTLDRYLISILGHVSDKTASKLGPDPSPVWSWSGSGLIWSEANESLHKNVQYSKIRKLVQTV